MALKGFSNVLLFTSYTLLEGVLILLIISRKTGTVFAKYGSLFFIVILSVLFLVTVINKLSNDIINSTESIIVFSFSIYFFAHLFQEAEVPSLNKYYFFWINAGFLFYFGANLFIDSTEHYFRVSKGQEVLFLWNFHLVINIIYNVLLTIGVWKIAAK